MLRFLIFTLIFFRLSNSYGSQYMLSGKVFDQDARPLEFSTVTLLDPQDSTLRFFGITDREGSFLIRNIEAGNYLLQAAFIGYNSFYKNVSFPGLSEDFGAILLRPKSIELGETEISAERIPIRIGIDTIEYDANAFKTRPDDVVEDLLRKLPGVEVDRSGNIKAQGEEVKKVLVDGKEFFGGDPKVATGNLPADAVDKVQVFEKGSEESEYTGVDDGLRSKTLNLLLKENRKRAWLGEMNAGYGTNDHYKLNAKAYRFSKSNQFAVLGMMNNVNQFGFSFGDYLDFNGGLRSLANSNGDIQLNSNEQFDFPIDFGQVQTGLLESGAGGMNFSTEKDRENRFGLSWLGSTVSKDLEEYTTSREFTGDDTYILKEENLEETSVRNHRLNIGGRKSLTPGQLLSVDIFASAGKDMLEKELLSDENRGGILLNNLNQSRENEASKEYLNFRLSYIRRWEGNWKYLKANAGIKLSERSSDSEWINLNTYLLNDSSAREDSYFEEKYNSKDYFIELSSSRALSLNSILTVSSDAGRNLSHFEYMTGSMHTEKRMLQDSLSAGIDAEYYWLRPGLGYRRNKKGSNLSASLKIETGSYLHSSPAIAEVTGKTFYFLPELSWEKELSRKSNLRAFYHTDVSLPESRQLFPLNTSTHTLVKSVGNMYLKPEYRQLLRLNWIYFDQFSFTSLFTSINARYTENKINWRREYDQQQSRTLSLVNVDNDLNVWTEMSFSTPIRKLKLNLSIDWEEGWNRGINVVNGLENAITNLRHVFGISFDNRKKDMFDISAGVRLVFNEAKFDIAEEQNKNYFTTGYFATVDYTPTEKWKFNLSADIQIYSIKDIEEETTIPLLNASLSRYLSKNNRFVLSLTLADILDKNKGIERISELNYFRESRSNMPGRYIMFSLKYKLNKFSGKSGDQIQIDFK